MTQSGEIAIIGGGAIGLSCAWKLAQNGARVTVFERLQNGRESSYAAGGMLAPTCEAFVHPWSCEQNARDKMLELCFASRDAYAGFAAELLDLTGQDIELCIAGSPTSDWRQPGIFYTPNNGEAPIEMSFMGEEKTFSGNKGVWLECDGHVDNRKLTDALRAACAKTGVMLHEQSAVRRIDIQDGHVRNLIVGENERVVPVDRVLICAGAWSAKINGLPPDMIPPVKPIAGQMLQLRGEKRVPHVIYSNNCYMIPRRDGRLIVGATIEDIGFNKRVTAGGVSKILECALRLVPELADVPLESHWAGLRPATPDGLPILGGCSIPNLFFATGHARNGILLTPQTAKIMTDLLIGQKSVDKAFSINRFKK
jgi:glycine oxidase